MRFESEEAMAAVVVAYLEDLQWTVYQEVTCEPGGRADIVATQGPLLWVVECKRSLSLDLIAQADEWRGVAHRVSIACAAPQRPKGRRRSRGHRRGGRFVRALLSERGIGWLSVDDQEVSEAIKPRLTRRVAPALRRALRPEHRTFAAAGNARSEFWSPFRDTCRRLRAIVQERPGITLKEAVAAIEHHYRTPSSAVGSLRHWIGEGKVPGVRLVQEGRRITLREEAA